MKRTKKRVEQEPMDMGKEKVEQLQHEANEAVHAFFYSNRPPIKKKSEKKKLKLAVPVSESTPFVKEMEQSGAGFVYNPTTGTTKAVGKGKHATKGRGIVSDQVIITKQLPTLNVEEITQSSSIIEACEPKISIEPGTADVADTSALTQDVVIVETIEADANEEEILKKSKWVIGTQMEGAPYFEDDGMIPSKPVYSNEVWAAGTIRT